VYVLFSSSGISGMIVAAFTVAGLAQLDGSNRSVVLATTLIGTCFALAGSFGAVPLSRSYITTFAASVLGSTASVNVTCIADSNVPNPSSVFSTPVRSAAAIGDSQAGAGRWTLPVVGSSTRLLGNGMIELPGSNSTVGPSVG